MEKTGLRRFYSKKRDSWKKVIMGYRQTNRIKQSYKESNTKLEYILSDIEETRQLERN
jgi:hypothetical protein